MFDSLLSGGEAFLPFLGGAILLGLVAFAFHHWTSKPSRRLKSPGMRRSIGALIVLVGLIVLVFTIPLSDETRGQLVGLLGVTLTAIIALSSTTFVTNAMAGLMLRILRKFKPGDWIQVGDEFGRVTEQGLLHTEIQTEDRDLTTIPNLFMVNQPVKVIRASGTIVSANVSLGYDAPRSLVNDLLISAAEHTGLTDPFVQITALKDFSAGYRVGGFLSDVTGLVGTRSRLRANMMDGLHGAGVEIVSPAFMNQRQTPDRIIPVADGRTSSAPHEAPEELAFDKAARASNLASLEQMIADRETALEEAKKETSSAENEVEIGRIEAELEALGELVTNFIEDPETE